MNKLLQFFFFIILLISCKGETEKSVGITSDSSVTEKKINLIPKQNKENCYDYLTELVRSSNFPFSDWKVSKEKVNLLIDEENEEFIRAKLLIDTEGTGTIGWIEYHFKNGTLLNTSANLETPQELKYNLKWKKFFDDCFDKVIQYQMIE